MTAKAAWKSKSGKAIFELRFSVQRHPGTVLVQPANGAGHISDLALENSQHKIMGQYGIEGLVVKPSLLLRRHLEQKGNARVRFANQQLSFAVGMVRGYQNGGLVPRPRGFHGPADFAQRAIQQDQAVEISSNRRILQREAARAAVISMRRMGDR